MKIIQLTKSDSSDSSDSKTAASIEQFEQLITLLNERQLLQHTVGTINNDIIELDDSTLIGKSFLTLLKRNKLKSLRN